MIKSGIIAFAIVLVAMISPAFALADVTIKPDSGSNVLPDGTIQVPIDTDAAISVGLGVQYSGFVAGNLYTQDIRDSSNIVVPGTASMGGLPTGTDFIAVHWTPTSADLGKTFTITAEGTTSVGSRTRTVKVTAPGNPIPELSTSILTAAGMIGLLGMVILRKKN